MENKEKLVAAVQNKVSGKRSKKPVIPDKPKKVLDRETYLYRHFDKNGVLLYVGISLSAIVRFCRHRSDSPWYRDIATIKIERFGCGWDARIAEHLAIRDELPLYNSPKWRRFVSYDDIEFHQKKMARLRSLPLDMAATGRPA